MPAVGASSMAPQSPAQASTSPSGHRSVQLIRRYPAPTFAAASAVSGSSTGGGSGTRSTECTSTCSSA